MHRSCPRLSFEPSDRDSNHRPQRRWVGWVCAGLVSGLWALSGWADPGPIPATAANPSAKDSSTLARQALLEARRAARAVETVSYRFVNGHEKAPFGWVEGTVIQRRDPRGRWMRVEGTFHPQPPYQRPGFDFIYVVDPREASEWRSDTNIVVVASLDNDPLTASGLASNASYGFLPEFVESTPFWKELDLTTELALAGTVEIDGKACNVVRTTMAGAHGPTYQDWYLDPSSHLPCGLLWWMEMGPMRAEMPFSMLDVEIGATLPEGTFQLEAPEGAQVVSSDLARVRLGDEAPDWTLQDVEGKTVRLADFRGEVVVLDFWNTSCYLCHNALPQIASLATTLADQPVSFFALDFWEQGDAKSYWKERGFSPRLLLEADAVANQYGVSGQPAVVVVGRDGKVLHAQIGFTADRAERVLRAIEQGLAVAGP